MKLIIIKNFCTNTNIQKIVPFTQLYGYQLRDKFAAICKAELSRKILNQTERGEMLLREDIINTSHVDKIFAVYNGIRKVKILIKLNMVGFRIGEFVFSKKVQNLNVKGNIKVRKIFKRIEKPKAILSSYQKDVVKENINILKYYEQKNNKINI